MKYTDNIFCSFVTNSLSSKEMQEAEALVIENGDADASIFASMSYYDLNSDSIPNSDEDDDFYSHIYSKYDRKSLSDVSLLVNRQKNNIMETLRFKKSEIDFVKKLGVQFTETEDKEKSLQENLVDFYMNSFPGQVGSKTATKVIEDITLGITTFNEQLTEALKQAGEDGEVNYIAALTEAGADKTAEERYELYASSLVLLETLESSNLNEDKMNFKESFAELKNKHFVVPEGEAVTQEMENEILEKINACLNNSTFCLSALESSRDLISTINDEERTMAVIKSAEEDMRAKMILATSTYIAVKKGEVSSLGTDADPKFVALGVAAGIEQDKVVTEVELGNINESIAAEIIKMIGAVALIGALILASAKLTIVAAFSTFLLENVLGMYGCTAVAILTFFVSGLLFAVTSIKIVKISDKIFDKVVDVFRKNVVPRAKKTWRAIKVWVKSIVSPFFEDDSDEEYSEDKLLTISDEQKLRIK